MSITNFFMSLSVVGIFAAMMFILVVHVIRQYAKRHGDWIAVEFLDECTIVAGVAFAFSSAGYAFFKLLSFFLSGD